MSAWGITVRLTRYTFGYFLFDLLFAFITYLLMPIVTGLLAQSLFNAIAGHHALSLIELAIAGMVGIQIAATLAGPAFLAPWSSMQQKAQVLLRRNLLEAILRDHGHHDESAAPGDVVSRFRDDPALVADLLDCVCDLIGRFSFIVAAAVIMWPVDPLLTVVLAVPVTVTTVLTVLAGGYFRRLRMDARVASGHVTAFLGDVLAGQLAVKVAGASDHVVARLTGLGHDRRRAQVRDFTFSAMIEAFNLNIGNIGTALILLVAAGSMARGRFTVGDLALFVVYAAAVNWFPDEVGRLIGGLRQTDVSVDRMNQLAPGEPRAVLVGLPSGRPTDYSHERRVAAGIDGRTAVEAAQDHPPTGSGPGGALVAGPGGGSAPATRGSSFHSPLESLEVHGLSYLHPATGRGIVDISFALPRGTLTVVTGRIGAGKTTLLRALLGLLPRQEGDILWNGCPVLDPVTFLVPPRAAYTPQVPRLFTDTLRENVLLGWPSDQEGLMEAVESAVLGPDLMAMSEGLDTRVGPRGIRLSGGQIQRVAAARMFVRDPQLLVIDDLSSALDVQTEAELWERFFDRSTGTTCLVVSHQPLLLKRADQVVRLSNGRLKT